MSSNVEFGFYLILFSVVWLLFIWKTSTKTNGVEKKKKSLNCEKTFYPVLEYPTRLYKVTISLREGETLTDKMLLELRGGRLANKLGKEYRTLFMDLIENNTLRRMVYNIVVEGILRNNSYKALPLRYPSDSPMAEHFSMVKYTGTTMTVRFIEPTHKFEIFNVHVEFYNDL